MEKIFILKGLDCPHCSSKIETAAANLDFVSSAAVNLIKQTLTVSVNSDYNGNLKDEVEKLVHTYEPEIEVLENNPRQAVNNSEENGKRELVLIIIGAVIYFGGLIMSKFTNVNNYITLAVLIISYLLLGGEVLLQAVKNILKGRVFDENFLMSVSTLSAFAIAEYPEAVAVMLFYRIGEYFEDTAVHRSRKSISSLMDIRPDSARVMRNGEFITADAGDIQVGETVLVKPGERIPLDGIVTDGESMLDTSALTGESVPRSAKKGDSVLSGCININGILTIEVTKAFYDSTATKIIDLVENAASKKAPTENFITTFSRYYTPVVVVLALLLAIIPPLLFAMPWSEWIRRGCVFLVISCPCALVISIPLTFFGGIGSASRKGVLIKGGNYLEALNQVDTLVFDKTGTLTKGIFKVTDVITANGFSKSEIIESAAAAESMSNHPIARSIEAEYGKDSIHNVTECKEIAGQGVIAVLNNSVRIAVGNERLMNSLNIDFVPSDITGTNVYVASNGTFAGTIIINDEIKDGCRDAIKALKTSGIRKTVMLTGDSADIAKSVSDELGIDEYSAELLPDMKVAAIEKISSENGKSAFIGDGINDAPVLSRADVGIAMGALGSDAAIEAADIVLMNDDIHSLLDAIYTAKATKNIVMQNIIFALGVKVLFLILGAFGIAGMWEAVFGDVGVMIIAVLNSMRILRK